MSNRPKDLMDKDVIKLVNAVPIDDYKRLLEYANYLEGLISTFYSTFSESDYAKFTAARNELLMQGENIQKKR